MPDIVAAVLAVLIQYSLTGFGLATGVILACKLFRIPLK
jgi:hypothetical protein